MDCERIRPTLTDLAAGELSALPEWSARQHLKTCPACQKEAERIAHVFAAVAADAIVDTVPPAPNWRTIPAPAAPFEKPMEENRPRKSPIFARLLPLAAASALIAVALLPNSGPLVVRQLRSALGGDRAIAETPDAILATGDDATRAAAAHPGDRVLSLGAALAQTGDVRRAALEIHQKRFPNDPVPIAAQIRATMATPAATPMASVTPAPPRHWPQPDGQGPWTPGADVTGEMSPRNARLLALTEAGERAAPDNAFFPLLRAYVLFDESRPQAAIAAARDAGAKPRYDDYTGETFAARCAIEQAARGPGGPLIDTILLSAMAGEGMPTLAPFRADARSTAAYARGLEISGREREGLELRLALMRISGAMQRDSDTLVAGMTGRAMGAHATETIGNTPVPDARKLPADEVRRIRRARFDTHARRLRRPDIADAAQRLYAESQTIQRVTTRASDGQTGLERFQPALAWSALSLYLLLSALWTVLLGGIAYALARTGRIRQGATLHPAVAWGLPLALVLPIGATLGVTYFITWGGVPLFGGLIMLGLAFWRLRHAPGRNALICITTILAVWATIGVAGWLTAGPAGYAGGTVSGMGLPQSMTDDSSASPEEMEAAAKAADAALVTIVLGGACVLLPTLTTIGLAIRSRRRRIPASVGVVRGFRAIAVPVASVLILLYTFAAYNAARAERAMHDELIVQMQHEGAYFARLYHLPWPN